MAALSRRATIALPAGLAAFHASAATVPGQSESPDADLIRLCGEYIAAIDAYNESPDTTEPEDHPLWHAIEDLEAKLDGLDAKTMEGLTAKARVVLHLARMPDGTHNFSSSCTGDWAGQVVRDLLRIVGGVAG
jgi:hypothetical protein